MPSFCRKTSMSIKFLVLGGDSGFLGGGGSDDFIFMGAGIFLNRDNTSSDDYRSVRVPHTNTNTHAHTHTQSTCAPAICPNTQQSPRTGTRMHWQVPARYMDSSSLALSLARMPAVPAPCAPQTLQAHRLAPPALWHQVHSHHIQEALNVHLANVHFDF